MKKTLKEYRKSNNLSQQELSERSGISIRTIQRIEKNLSQGSPFILKSLSKALNIEVSDLEIEPADLDLDQLEEENETTPEPKLKAINLSAIFVMFFPLINIIVPSILYVIYKKQLKNKSVALKILSFQILWTLLTILLMFLIPAIVTPFFEVLNSGKFPFFFLVYYVCVVVNVYFIIVTAIKLNKSEPILPFVPNIL